MAVADRSHMGCNRLRCAITIMAVTDRKYMALTKGVHAIRTASAIASMFHSTFFSFSKQMSRMSSSWMRHRTTGPTPSAAPLFCQMSRSHADGAMPGSQKSRSMPTAPCRGAKSLGACRRRHANDPKVSGHADAAMPRSQNSRSMPTVRVRGAWRRCEGRTSSSHSPPLDPSAYGVGSLPCSVEPPRSR